MEKIEQLKYIGFRKVGKWELNNNEITFNFFNKNISNKSEVLYAFVINDRIMYIGKTKQKISQRLYNYKKAHSSQKTNVRIKEKIINEITNNNNTVEIYLFENTDNQTFKGIKINLSAGLEDNVIKEINPIWNIL